MSLINEMLKDLDKRDKQRKSTEALLSGLRSSSAKPPQKLGMKWTLMIVFSLIFMTFIVQEKHRHTLKVENNLLAAKLARLTTIKPSGLLEASTQHDPEVFYQNQGPSLLTGVAMQVEEHSSLVQLLLNKPELYSLEYYPERHELDITFDHTNLLAAIPKMDYLNSGLMGIQALNDDNGNLKLVLNLSARTELKTLDLQDAEKTPELDLQFSVDNTEIPDTKKMAEEKPLSVKIQNPVVENATETAYQEAVQSINQGDDLAAIEVLKQLAINYPSYQAGRELLIKLLLKHDKQDEALEAADAGLNLLPNSYSLAELKAHILVDLGHHQEAIALLQKNPPSLERNPDYHAFIAALYQHQGQSDMAANIYKQLLNLQPNNAKWWLGLGVALQASGQHADAMDAFANANSLGDLSPELKAYIETQLHNA